MENNLIEIKKEYIKKILIEIKKEQNKLKKVLFEMNITEEDFYKYITLEKNIDISFYDQVLLILLNK